MKDRRIELRCSNSGEGRHVFFRRDWMGVTNDQLEEASKFSPNHVIYAIMRSLIYGRPMEYLPYRICMRFIRFKILDTFL
jgi:hypothetical protein